MHVPVTMRCRCPAVLQVSGLQRERTKLAILQEAVIVASTLSFAGEAMCAAQRS